jgi:HAD superfamily hydrolase (TIGR01509 family)
MSLPRTPHAVLFDMDGLLLDTEALYRTAIMGACAELGFPMSDELHLSLVGCPLDANRIQLETAFGPSFPFEAYVASYRGKFAALAVDGIPTRPGAPELLAYLAEAGVPMAVATSTGRPAALKHLTQAGLIDHFRAVVARDDVSRGKPDPEVFLTAAQRLGVDPSLCLALEDSHNGVRAASSAGMMTVMVPDLLAPTAEMQGLCVAIAPDLHAVQAMLQDRLEAVPA